MGLFGRSRRQPAEEVLAEFIAAHRLAAPVIDIVDELLPRSCQVVDAHQLRQRASDYGWRWWGGQGMLPGGIEGSVARVEIWDKEQHQDVFDVVRAPAPAGALLPTVEITGPTHGDLRAYGGHRMSDVPFRPGEAQRVDLAEVGRAYKARVPRGAAPAVVARAVSPELTTWLAATRPPFCFELFDGWLSVFRLDRSGGADDAFYPGLCDAARRFRAACAGEAAT